MKKSLLLSMIAMIFVFGSAFASNSTLFSYDKQQLQDQFEVVDQLEAFVAESNGMTYEEVTVANVTLAQMLQTDNVSANAPMNPMFSVDDMDWGSFAWGFCCWPVGFFVVAINSNKTSDQKLSYWIGLGVSVILSTISNVIYYTAY